MARCYSNENFPRPAVEELGRLGHDVLTSAEAGNANKAVADEEVLAFANRERRVVLTFNRRHFIRLHQTHPAHSGIEAATFDRDFIALAKRIHRVLESQQDLSGTLVRVNRDQ